MRKEYKHIGEIDYVDFYTSVFPSAQEAKEFVGHVASMDNSAKIIIFQAARMLYLADIIHQKGRPALQLLFFLIAAEAIAKLTFNFKDEGKSRDFIKRFFNEICNDKHKNRLKRAFKKQNTEKDFISESYLSLEETIDFLYAIRCDVVHRGAYFDNLYLKDHPDDTNILFPWKKQYISPNISTDELRNIIMEGAILGCCMSLPDGDKYKTN